MLTAMAARPCMYVYECVMCMLTVIAARQCVYMCICMH